MSHNVHSSFDLINVIFQRGVMSFVRKHRVFIDFTRSAHTLSSVIDHLPQSVAKFHVCILDIVLFRFKDAIVDHMRKVGKDFGCCRKS